MSKVFLVYEDYADLMSVEATLKRVGFDVLGITSEYSMADQMIGFNPDLVVGSGSAGKVTTLGVGKRLREMTRWQGKSILIFPPNFKPAPQELIKIRVDMILEAPVQPLRLVQVIARLLGQDEAVLLERLNKSMADPQFKVNSGSFGSSGESLTDEEAIYVKGELPHDEDSELGVDNQSESQRIGFRFGSRMNAAELETEEESASADEAFPDVDLKALENELRGGGVPEAEKVVEIEDEVEPLIEPNANPLEAHRGDLSPEAEVAAEDAEYSEEQLRRELAGEDDLGSSEATLSAEESLRAAEAGLQAKMSRYRDMTKDVSISPRSTITRVEARKRQNSLASGWDKDDLGSLDKQRRSFTKALFKK